MSAVLKTNQPPVQADQAPAAIEFELDGRAVQAHVGETILQAAERHGVEIPRLCYTEGLRADGNCRACVVEIEGERTLAPSCCRAVQPGMKVKATSERARKSQDMVLEMLLAELPAEGFKWNDSLAPCPGGGRQGWGPTTAPTEAGSAPTPTLPQRGREQEIGQHGELTQWAAQRTIHVRESLQHLKRAQPAPDLSHPAMAVNLSACIQCTRCVRACREAQVNDVIGYAGRGSHARIVFDLGDDMGASSCVACGECVQACPTGALMPKTQIGSQKVDAQVDSVCPFCGVGCQITYNVRDAQIVSVSGRDGPANEKRLCVKGRFGFDYVASPDRLTVPLIRKPGVTKDPAHCDDRSDWRAVFREATWDEALALAAGQLVDLKARHGPKSLAGFGSAKGSNEEAYLFQKLIRTGFGSNNVDHCTRLCHASSVAALLEGVGSGAVSNPVKDVEFAELILIIGSNPTANHPVAATWMKNAAQRGARIVLADPRVTDIARHAWRVLPFKPGADVAMLNALLHVIVTEGLVDQDFIRERADNYAALVANVQGYSPEAMAPICGIPAATLREVARAYATAKSSIILWGMGVSQHVHGTDNVRCLIALATCTGQIGRPGTGLHPLRGQNNVQGASDAGLIPMVFPDYQPVGDAQIRAAFEELWNTPLHDKPGLTVVEIVHAIHAGTIRGMYIQGENPAMSDPDLEHARGALAKLEHLVVQDLFVTETAQFADVILPASAWAEKDGTVTNTNRQVQMGRAAVPLPGDARPDWWIIQEIARRLGLDWHYTHPRDVFAEMKRGMHSLDHISWERLEAEESVTYPCPADDAPGMDVVFGDRFPTTSGRARFRPTVPLPPDEPVDDAFPTVLITGRQLEHWHTGSMTRRATVLDALEPAAVATLAPGELARIGLEPGAALAIETRRGKITLTARTDPLMPEGMVFVPFCYVEAAANMLTNPALDPYGKIPEFKYAACKLGAGDGAGQPA